MKTSDFILALILALPRNNVVVDGLNNGPSCILINIYLLFLRYNNIQFLFKIIYFL